MMVMVTPLLGVMELDASSREWKDLSSLAITWLQDAGGFAAIGLLLWVIYVLTRSSPSVVGSRRVMISRFMAVTGALALVGYLVAGGLTYSSNLADKRFAAEQGITKKGRADDRLPQRERTWVDVQRENALTISGLLALLAFSEPFFVDLLRLRWRRVYAIAKLSFTEAIRRRIVWVFFIFLLIFLFPATWFFFKNMKPEHVLKTTISVIAYAMTALLVLTALLLSGFSIPTDIKNQTIHTIVTKPVERFEIVAGRFLGYVALETMALFALTGVSLVFILTSNVDEAARAESMKARVPVYGKLNFVRDVSDVRSRAQAFEGVDVGREYSYRKYIYGGEKSSHRAVWMFSNKRSLGHLTDMSAVPLEFAFDVYRTTKGLENRGVACSFDVQTWKWDPAREEEYQKAVRTAFGSLRNVQPESNLVSPEQAAQDWKKISEIAETFGRFEFKNYPVFDYHTYQLMLPPGLLRNAVDGNPVKDTSNPKAGDPMRLMVKVKCESNSQLIGVAPLDLYLLESEGLFWLNFFKAAIGLWCRLTIVIGLSVAASTYFAGVVSFLLALCLFLGGYFQMFIYSLSRGGNAGGGPFESFTRLVKGSVAAAELDNTPTVQVALLGDDAFRWVLRRILNVIPDTEGFTWSKYLAEGFNINSDFILLNLLFLAAYMVPWAVLAYYLMRSREIAA